MDLSGQFVGDFPCRAQLDGLQRIVQGLIVLPLHLICDGTDGVGLGHCRIAPDDLGLFGNGGGVIALAFVQQALPVERMQLAGRRFRLLVERGAAVDTACSVGQMGCRRSQPRML